MLKMFASKSIGKSKLPRTEKPRRLAEQRKNGGSLLIRGTCRKRSVQGLGRRTGSADAGDGENRNRTSSFQQREEHTISQ